MPCDTRLRRRGQTLQQRAAEVKKVAVDVDTMIAAGKVKPVVDRRTGAIAFQGLTDAERDGATDACIYRRIMVSGSSHTKAALLRAEQLAGRSVDKQALAQGVHSHDGGQSWGTH
jgi:hypothetical protein